MMTKEPHPALNAEQEAGAKKDAGGFAGSLFVARLKPGPPMNYRPNPAPPIQREGEPKIHVNGVNEPVTAIIGTPNHVAVECDVPNCDVVHLDAKPVVIYVEAERWVDARAFALRKLGVCEAEVKPHALVDGERKPLPRWQVRGIGISGHPTNGYRMQARQIQNEPTKDQGEHWWKDVRES